MIPVCFADRALAQSCVHAPSTSGTNVNGSLYCLSMPRNHFYFGAVWNARRCNGLTHTLPQTLTEFDPALTDNLTNAHTYTCTIITLACLLEPAHVLKNWRPSHCGSGRALGGCSTRIALRPFKSCVCSVFAPHFRFQCFFAVQSCGILLHISHGTAKARSHPTLHPPQRFSFCFQSAFFCITIPTISHMALGVDLQSPSSSRTRKTSVSRKRPVRKGSGGPKKVVQGTSQLRSCRRNCSPKSRFR